MFTALLLAFLGRVALGVIGFRHRSLLTWSLSYPLGAFLNALLFFCLHLLRIPFGAVSLIAGHLVLIVGCVLLQRIIPSAHQRPQQVYLPLIRSLWRDRSWCERAIIVCCGLFLGVILTTSIVAVTTLPMFYWDSFAHWGLRSKKSLDAGFLMMQGVIQPQYPILLHALQMAHASLPGWSDQAVNTGTFLLSLSAYLGIFLLVRQRTDAFCALITITLLTGIPLVIIHLRQSMADIHVTAYVLLSALLLDLALKERNRSALLLSALFVAAAMWTKFEGLYFGLTPWLAIVGLHALTTKTWLTPLRYGILPALLAAAPWPLFVLSQGMKLSPHGRSFGFHPEGIAHFLEQLFGLGTFGLHWWAIMIILSLILWSERKHLFAFLPSRPSLLWALMAFALLIYVYIFTDEVRGLIQRDNFSRAALLSTMIFTCSLSIESWKRCAQTT